MRVATAASFRVGAVLLLALQAQMIACKPQSASEIKTVVDVGNRRAIGFLPVKRYLPEANQADAAALSLGQQWAKDQMTNAEYFALIKCDEGGGLDAAFWFKSLENTAIQSVLFVDATGSIRFNFKSAEYPDGGAPCDVVGHRLLTYPVVEDLLTNANGSLTITAARFALMQDFYVSLRSSYSQANDSLTRTKTLLLPLVAMYQRDRRLASVDADAFLKDFLAKDADFIPDACGPVGKSRLPGAAGEWKNANYECVEGSAPGVKNFLPSGVHDFDAVMRNVSAELDRYHASEQPQNERERLVDVLTNLAVPVPSGLLTKNYGAEYLPDAAPASGGAVMALTGCSGTQSCSSARILQRNAATASTTRPNLQARPGPTRPPGGQSNPTRPPGGQSGQPQSAQVRPFTPALGAQAILNDTRPLNQINGAGSDMNGDLARNDAYTGFLNSVAGRPSTTGLDSPPQSVGAITPVSFPAGSPFTGSQGTVTDSAGTAHNVSVITNSNSRESFLVENGSWNHNGTQVSGQFMANAPHFGTNPADSAFVGWVNHSGGTAASGSGSTMPGTGGSTAAPGTSAGTGAAANPNTSTATLIVADQRYNVGMTGNSRDGYLYNCQDLAAARRGVEAQTGLSTDQRTAAMAAIDQWGNSHSNCAGSRSLRLTGGEGDCEAGAGTGTDIPSTSEEQSTGTSDSLEPTSTDGNTSAELETPADTGVNTETEQTQEQPQEQPQDQQPQSSDEPTE